jgi:import receptor subunit TOM22
MFPESVRNATHTAAVSTQIGMKSVYGFSRNALWIVFSTSIILFAPVIFEVERAQMEEMQRNQQKQVRRVATCRGRFLIVVLQMLLGPNTAVSGGGMPLMPPMQR